MIKIIELTVLSLLLSETALAAVIIKRTESNYPDGNPREVVYFLKDEEVARESFDEEGNISRLGVMPDGVVEEYYDSKTIKVKSRFKNGRRNGRTREYYENGKPKALINYVDGIKNGKTREYNENGKLEKKINYENGVKSGLTREYDANGKIEHGWNYRDGVLEGVSYRYFSNGMVRWEEGYRVGKKQYRKKFSKKGRMISKKEYE